MQIFEYVNLIRPMNSFTLINHFLTLEMNFLRRLGNHST